jgi:DNA-binding response OmpR family regulator
MFELGDSMEAQFVNTAEVILLVDDDTPVREFICQCLEVAGHRVLQARSGREGIEVFRDNRHEITLVLTDIVMPALFGDQMALRLLEISPHLKIIFMSGNTPGSLETGIQLEIGKNFLQKPFSIQELRECIHFQQQLQST